jgi:hypothetical protein
MHRKGRQGLLHRYGSPRQCLAVLMMGRALLGLLPEICNGMGVGRIRRQRMPREAIGMLGPTWRGRLTGMIPRPVMDEQQGGRGLRQDGAHARVVTVRGTPSLDALRAPASGKRLQSAQDLGALACATRFALGVLATARPRGASRPPWAQRASSSKRSRPCRRLAARRIRSHSSWSQA